MFDKQLFQVSPINSNKILHFSWKLLQNLVFAHTLIDKSYNIFYSKYERFIPALNKLKINLIVESGLIPL